MRCVLIGIVTLASCAGCTPPGPGACGTGTWRPGDLEIHHLALGQADATLLVGPTGRTLLVDAGEDGPAQPGRAPGAERIAATIERVLGCRHLDAALVTHFHHDHVGAVGQGGLHHLIFSAGVTLGRLWHRDLAHAGAEGAVLADWRVFLAMRPPRLPAAVVPLGPGALDLGPDVRIDVVARDATSALRPGRHGHLPSPPNENDYSVGFVLRFGRLDYLSAGDLSGQLVAHAESSYHDVETVVARGLPDVDVYRVNHHGSDHASNPTFLAQIDPEVAIVSAGTRNRHGHPGRATLGRLAATGAVHRTRDAPGTGAGQGDVVLRSHDGHVYTVAGASYLATDPARADADGDGYFRETDPDDFDRNVTPALHGGCDPAVQICKLESPR